MSWKYTLLSIKLFFKPTGRKIIMLIIIIIGVFFLTLLFMPGAEEVLPVFWPAIVVFLLPIFVFSRLFSNLLISLSLNLIYLYFISCLIIFLHDNYKNKIKKLWQEKTLGKLIIIGFILVGITCLFFSTYFNIKNQTSPLARPKDSRIISAISTARTEMAYVGRNDGNYDNFTCSYEEMIQVCQEIDVNYGEDNDKEPIIAHDLPVDSHAACIYTPLNIKKNYWYCADSTGAAGYAQINPGSPGYCIEGKSAICPPLLKDIP